MDGKLVSTLALLATLTASVSAQSFGVPERPMERSPYLFDQTLAQPLYASPNTMNSGSYFDVGAVTEASWVSALGDMESKEGACSDCYCPPAWAHRTGMFGELLYLRPRNAEVAYAVPFNGAVVPPGGAPVQVGPVAVASPEFDPGFRVGITKAFDECSSIALTYARFQGNENDAVAQAPLRAMVLHPGTANAAQNFLTANSSVDVDFDLIDLDYRAVWNSSDCWAMNYLIGVRYARMDQDFNAQFTQVGSADTLASRVNFEGLGLRLGLDGERHTDRGWLMYGRLNASFVAGEFGSSYLQGSTAQPVIVNTAWDGTRIVPILDFELGAGWQSKCGRYRLTGGYMISAWFNALNNDTWIQGVQTNNFVDLSDSVTFDGFTARAEYRF